MQSRVTFATLSHLTASPAQATTNIVCSSRPSRLPNPTSPSTETTISRLIYPFAAVVARSPFKTAQIQSQHMRTDVAVIWQVAPFVLTDADALGIWASPWLMPRLRSNAVMAAGNMNTATIITRPIWRPNASNSTLPQLLASAVADDNSFRRPHCDYLKYIARCLAPIRDI